MTEKKSIIILENKKGYFQWTGNLRKLEGKKPKCQRLNTRKDRNGSKGTTCSKVRDTKSRRQRR